jgi:hypothetical protein
MKALHITFRYGKDVYGGAELYFRRLSEELKKHGVDIDICTTQTHTLTPFIKSGTEFDNSLRDETINGIKVFRFPVKKQNRYLSIFFEKLIQRKLSKSLFSKTGVCSQTDGITLKITGTLSCDGPNPMPLL